LPLCLTKYHAMKMLPNYVPFHQDVWGSGGMDSRIF